MYVESEVKGKAKSLLFSGGIVNRDSKATIAVMAAG